MVMLETATLLIGIGLSSVSVSDTPMQSTEQCQAYLAAQARRYEKYIAPGSNRFEIQYKVLGSEYLVIRTCLNY